MANVITDFPLRDVICTHIIKNEDSGAIEVQETFSFKARFIVLNFITRNELLDITSSYFYGVVKEGDVTDGSYQFVYNGNYSKDGHPTQEEFNAFYTSDGSRMSMTRGFYYPAVGRTLTNEYTFSTVDGSQIPLFYPIQYGHDLPASAGYQTYKFTTSKYYSYDGYLNIPGLSQQYIGMSLVKHSEIITQNFVHTFYVNGGVLGSSANYTITEVITSEESEEILWQTSAQSRLGVHKASVGTDNYWEVIQGTNNLDSSYQTIQDNVLKSNGVSNLEWFFTGSRYIRVIHKPQYVNKRTGETFYGKQYSLTFFKELPQTAGEVNNDWAMVTEVSSEETDAHNIVRVVYGQAPDSTTPDEQTREDIRNNGNNSDDSDSKKGSASDLHYGVDDGSVTNSVTKLYELNETQLTSFASELWSQTYLDVLKIQDNPIENVISIKKLPFALNGTSANINIGNVTFGTTAYKIDKGIHEITFASKKLGGKYGNFLDKAPFTSAKIVLPYIGVYDLPIDEIMDSMIGVKYYIDLVHGDCTATVLVDNYPLYEFHGTMGINIPLTQTDRKDAEIKHFNAIISGASSSLGSLVGGDFVGAISSGVGAVTSGMKNYNLQRTSSGSGGINMRVPQDIRIIISRPETIAFKKEGNDVKYITYPNGFGHNHGYPLYESRKIGDLYGFVKCGNNIDTTGILANETIKNKIVSLLQSGVYV